MLKSDILIDTLEKNSKPKMNKETEILHSPTGIYNLIFLVIINILYINSHELTVFKIFVY